ncbi:MAG: TetR/AcrR family transcriptional regulator, partial [Acidimicrobiales bacterium]
LGAVRRDLDLDLMVEMTMALTEAGDRWLVSHWDRVHVADSQELAVLSLSLLRRLVAPEKEGS